MFATVSAVAYIPPLKCVGFTPPLIKFATMQRGKAPTGYYVLLYGEICGLLVHRYLSYAGKRVSKQ